MHGFASLLAPEEPIDLRLAHRGGRVRLASTITVPESRCACPNARDQAVADAHGLVIVAALSASWGVERDAQGCTVWCEVVTEDRRTDVHERDVTTVEAATTGVPRPPRR